MRVLIIILITLIWSITSHSQIPNDVNTNILADEWEALLDGDYNLNIDRLGGCRMAERRLKLAMANGYDANKAWMMIGQCRSEVARETKFQSSFENCEKLKSNERKNIPYIRSWKLVMDAFNQVELTAMDYREAQNWVSFSEASMRSLDARCKIPHHPPLCFFEIKRYYDQVDSDNKAELSEYCERFLPSYNSKYRIIK